jgi:hypothetical protein
MGVRGLAGSKGAQEMAATPPSQQKVVMTGANDVEINLEARGGGRQPRWQCNRYFEEARHKRPNLGSTRLEERCG